jgi:predicted nucleic acid-binding protein
VSAVVDASLLVAATSDAGAERRWAEDVVRAGGLGRLGRMEAGTAARDLLLFDLELVPFTPFAERVWELRANVTSYDAWYVAVAEQCDLPLATLDHRLARATGPRCRFLLPPLI